MVTCPQIIHSAWFTGKILQINGLGDVFLLRVAVFLSFVYLIVASWRGGFAPSTLGREGVVFIGDFAFWRNLGA
jgi:hypothetical protein